jgi:hypothetical protein
MVLGEGVNLPHFFLKIQQLRLNAMDVYKNLSGQSNVKAYEFTDYSITVQFSDGYYYLYSTSKAGLDNVIQMKSLAKNGKGLNSFINKNVKKLYDKKWK